MEELEEHAMGCQVREFHKSTFCYDLVLLFIFKFTSNSYCVDYSVVTFRFEVQSYDGKEYFVLGSRDKNQTRFPKLSLFVLFT